MAFQDDGIYQIKSADNESKQVGTIKDMHEVAGKILFFLEHVNVMDIDETTGEARTHLSEFPWVFSREAAQRAKKYKNGDLVRCEGFASQSEDKKSIKFKGRFIIDARPIIKTGAELNG